jgi:hypothetical protein
MVRFFLNAGRTTVYTHGRLDRSGEICIIEINIFF